MKFKDKVIIVTGGGQGIGRAICRSFAAEGSKVVIADIDIEAGIENQEYINSLGYTSHFIHTDVADENSVKNMVRQSEERFSTIDVLVNNAAIGGFSCMFQNSVDIWDRVIAVNLRGTFLCSRYCSEIMIQKGHGCIINIASTRAFMSEPDTEAYSASKGGIIALTHSLAVSLGKHRIRVNSISPGWIDVSGWQKSSSAKQVELTEIDHSQHPAGRVGIPEDISKACVFLCSDEAGFITGMNLTIDGGMTIKMIYQ